MKEYSWNWRESARKFRLHNVWNLIIWIFLKCSSKRAKIQILWRLKLMKFEFFWNWTQIARKFKYCDVRNLWNLNIRALWRQYPDIFYIGCETELKFWTIIGDMPQCAATVATNSSVLYRVSWEDKYSNMDADLILHTFDENLLERVVFSDLQLNTSEFLNENLIKTEYPLNDRFSELTVNPQGK